MDRLLGHYTDGDVARILNEKGFKTGRNLNGLVEAALFVENLSRARDFYQRVVGLT
jgi:hypothetical protein